MIEQIMNLSEACKKASDEISVVLTPGAIKEGYAYVPAREDSFFPLDARIARDKQEFPDGYLERGLHVAEDASSPGVRPVVATFRETGLSIVAPIAVRLSGAMRLEARSAFKQFFKDAFAVAGDVLVYRRSGDREYEVFLRRR